jgi:hypothetical protein
MSYLENLIILYHSLLNEIHEINDENNGQDYEENEDKLTQIKKKPTSDKIEKKWIQHVDRMQRDRLLKQLKDYKPQELKNRGRTLQRLLED